MCEQLAQGCYVKAEIRTRDRRSRKASVATITAPVHTGVCGSLKNSNEPVFDLR